MAEKPLLFIFNNEIGVHESEAAAAETITTTLLEISTSLTNVPLSGMNRFQVVAIWVKHLSVLFQVVEIQKIWFL